ncbi:hypothetical protein ACLHK8_01365 [Pediococcus sp. M21F004]|uniref:hypothetical protein n=1 Tax=Pediococcus sp. M21F004 TaxID=3390033 RepID=UPI003DA6E713
MNRPGKEEVMKKLQNKNPYNVEIEKVIHITTRAGDGSDENRVRLVEHYYDKNGHLLFETE